MSLFPNPNTGTFKVISKTGLSLALFDAVGKFLFQLNIPDGRTEIDLHELPAGIYFLKPIGGEAIPPLRLVKE